MPNSSKYLECTLLRYFAIFSCPSLRPKQSFALQERYTLALELHLPLIIAGLLAVVAVLSLSLIVYCWPLKHHALSSSKGSSQNQNQRPQGKLGSPLLQSAEAAATFLGSKGGLDGSKLEVQGRKSDKISATSIKGKLGLPNQSLEDSVQQEGVDVSSEENRERAAFSINELREGECGNGVCRNGSVSEGDFVFAVATHQNNEPTLMAGRAGRLVSCI